MTNFAAVGIGALSMMSTDSPSGSGKFASRKTALENRLHARDASPGSRILSLLGLGNLHLEFQYWDGAVRYFRQALDLIHDQQEQFKQGAQEQALSDNAQSAALGLAQGLYHHGRAEEAIAALAEDKQARQLKLKPLFRGRKYEEALCLLGEILHKMGRKKEAAALLSAGEATEAPAIVEGQALAPVPPVPAPVFAPAPTATVSAPAAPVLASVSVGSASALAKPVPVPATPAPPASAPAEAQPAAGRQVAVGRLQDRSQVSYSVLDDKGWFVFRAEEIPEEITGEEIPLGLLGSKISCGRLNAHLKVSVEWEYFPEFAFWISVALTVYEKNGNIKSKRRISIALDNQRGMVYAGFRMSRNRLLSLVKEKGACGVCAKTSPGGLVALGHGRAGKRVVKGHYCFRKRESKLYYASLNEAGIATRFEFSGIPEPVVLEVASVKKGHHEVLEWLESHTCFHSARLKELFDELGYFWVEGRRVQAKDKMGQYAVLYLGTYEGPTRKIHKYNTHVPAAYALQPARFLIGHSGLSVFIHVDGKADAQLPDLQKFLKRLEIRSADNKFLKVITLYYDAMDSGWVAFGSRKAAQLGGVLVAARLKPNRCGIIPLWIWVGEKRIYLPKRDLQGIPLVYEKLYAEVVFAFSESAGSALPVEVRLGYYSAEDPFQPEASMQFSSVAAFKLESKDNKTFYPKGKAIFTEIPYEGPAPVPVSAGPAPAEPVLVPAPPASTPVEARPAAGRKVTVQCQPWVDSRAVIWELGQMALKRKLRLQVFGLLRGRLAKLEAEAKVAAPVATRKVLGVGVAEAPTKKEMADLFQKVIARGWDGRRIWQATGVSFAQISGYMNGNHIPNSATWEILKPKLEELSAQGPPEVKAILAPAVPAPAPESAKRPSQKEVTDLFQKVIARGWDGRRIWQATGVSFAQISGYMNGNHIPNSATWEILKPKLEELSAQGPLEAEEAKAAAKAAPALTPSAAKAALTRKIETGRAYFKAVYDKLRELQRSGKLIQIPVERKKLVAAIVNWPGEVIADYSVQHCIQESLRICREVEATIEERGGSMPSLRHGKRKGKELAREPEDPLLVFLTGGEISNEAALKLFGASFEEARGSGLCLSKLNLPPNELGQNNPLAVFYLARLCILKGDVPKAGIFLQAIPREAIYPGAPITLRLEKDILKKKQLWLVDSILGNVPAPEVWQNALSSETRDKISAKFFQRAGEVKDSASSVLAAAVESVKARRLEWMKSFAEQHKGVIPKIVQEFAPAAAEQGIGEEELRQAAGRALREAAPSTPLKHSITIPLIARLAVSRAMENMIAAAKAKREREEEGAKPEEEDDKRPEHDQSGDNEKE